MTMTAPARNGSPAGQYAAPVTSTDLAVRPPQPLALAPPPSALVPKSVEEALIYAKAFAGSRMFAATSVDQAMTILLTGMELGLGPAQSMRAFHVIEGKPSPSADALVALCRRRPDICLYFRVVSSTATEAVCETLRAGEPAPVRASYTHEDARKAGLLNKQNWQKAEKQMLVARCKAMLARMTYEDLTLGLYTPDELREGAGGAAEFESGTGPEPFALAPGEIRAGQVAAITAVVKGSKSDPYTAARVQAAWDEATGGAKKFSEIEGDLQPVLDAVVRATEEAQAEAELKTSVQDRPYQEPAQEATFRDEVQAKANIAPVENVAQAEAEEFDPFAGDPFADSTPDAALTGQAQAEINAHQESVGKPAASTSPSTSPKKAK